MKNLNGKRAFVTGGTRGIGKAIVERLIADEAIVVATGRSRPTTLPVGCEFFEVDFTNKASADGFFAEIRAAAPDILINNAGINRIGPFADFSSDDFQLVQDVNVTAPFRLCQEVLPSMKAKGWGRIVNICSVWGKVGKELRAPYSASKFALAGLTAALAAEVTKFGILANCVSPGPIETDLTRSVLSEDMISDLLRSVPAGRLGRPEEVAALVAWLVGPDNTFVAGQNIAVDGGMTRV